jgi:hypothetical protein
MTDETVDQSTLHNARDDDPTSLYYKQASTGLTLGGWVGRRDRPQGTRQAIQKADLECDDVLRERVVRHIVEDTSQGDVRSYSADEAQRQRLLLPLVWRRPEQSEHGFLGPGLLLVVQSGATSGL